jgi:coproporphyrinogen III oxidase
MERETPEAAAPATFLPGAEPDSTRARFERMIRRVQGEVCEALEAVEGGGALFREDAWARPGGGGGISRVLQGGRVLEKAAVNVSVVYGVMPPEAYRAARPDAAAAAGGEKAGPVPFFAAGVSSVSEILSPVPTLANWRVQRLHLSAICCATLFIFRNFRYLANEAHFEQNSCLEKSWICLSGHSSN